QIGAGTAFDKTPVVWVAGSDPRGVPFGVGRLLRELRPNRLKVTLPADFVDTSAPTTPLRGHQIGYRPKTNSYDGWTGAMWAKQAASLRLCHPKAEMSMSPPSFPAAWMAEFYERARRERPWLAGVVFGPQTRVPLPKLRGALAPKLAVRGYPDITRSMRCQCP